MTYTATITSQGQVTIPKALREMFDLHNGSKLVFTVSREGITVEKVKALHQLHTLIDRKNSGIDVVNLIKETRREVANKKSQQYDIS